MKLGILSDSHDRFEIMGAAVKSLRERGAEFFIHCGDVCAPRMLAHLAGLKACFVWGNCDYDRPGLDTFGQSIEVPCHGSAAELELDGKRIAVLHGDDALRMQFLLRAKPDYLFHGHTHVLRDERVGATRIINPGALYRAARKTVALLDTTTDELEIIQVDPPL